MAKSDELIAEIKEAFRKRSSKAFLKPKGDKERESFNSIVEIKAKRENEDRAIKQQFGKLEEMVYRAELATLLDERNRQRSIEVIGLMQEQKVYALDMQFIRQNTEFIVSEIQKRLRSYGTGIYVTKGDIESYLEHVDLAYRAKLALGETVTAVPYVHFKAEAKEPQSGQARPVVLFGVFYPTIAAAHRANPAMSYDAIRMASMRELKKLRSK